MTSLGTLYGISVGTGDPELMTVKSLKRLQKTSIIAFPKGLSNNLGLAQQIVTPWLNSRHQLLPLNFPYTRDENTLQKAWQTAAKTVWLYLEIGQDVVFVCEGDISFYSTFTYLAQTLQENYQFFNIETIAGVCSPMAAVSALGIPLTIRDQRLAIIPALYRVEELEKVLEWADVIVLMKVASVYSQVWQILEKHQLFNHAFVVEKATLPDQKIHRNLDKYPHLKLPYFSLLILQIYPPHVSQTSKPYY